MSKYGVFSGSYFSVFGMNTEIYFVNVYLKATIHYLCKSVSFNVNLFRVN